MNINKLGAFSILRFIKSLFLALLYLRYLFLFFIGVLLIFFIIIICLHGNFDLITVKSLLLVFFGFDYEPNIITIPYPINILVRFFGYLFLGALLQALIKAFEFTKKNKSY